MRNSLGAICTGNLEAYDTLFLSPNPGFSRADGWPPEELQAKSQGTGEKIRYLVEYESGSKLARQIVDIIFDGDATRLGNCIEACYLSPFATPDVDCLNKSLNALSQELRDEHNELRKMLLCTLISTSNPKAIVVIGSTQYDGLSRRLSTIDGYDVSQPEWRYIANDRRRMFVEQRLANGIKLFGCIHLSGARFSNEKRNQIKAWFTQSWGQF